MNRERVSIAMTTYNGERFVEEQLASFAAQTRLPDELVVCDDASSDSTFERVERFAATAPFEVRAVRNPRQLTTTANFEKAVSLCTGDIVFFSDQDDVWAPHKVEKIAGTLEARPQLGAIFHDGLVCNESLESLGMTLWESLWFTPGEQRCVRTGQAPQVFVRHVVAAGSTLAFRSRYRDYYLPFPDLHDCHDAWVSFVVTALSSCAIEPESLIRYRIHGDNQFGLHKPTLREQIQQARKQLDVRIFDHGVRFFGAVRDRLTLAAERGQAPSTDLRHMVEEKIEHCRRRDGMSPRIWERALPIAAELLSGRYWRFSYGAKSVAQDLFLR